MRILQDVYTAVYEYFGGDEFLISVIGSNVVMIVCFWVINIPFLVVDITGKPAWVLRYKIQKDKNTPLERRWLMRGLRTAAYNNLFINVLASVYMYTLQYWRGCGFSPHHTPSAARLLLDIAVFTLTQEICFYYTHRLFHHPKIYKWVHKKHHEWTAPIGITAIYTTEVEYLTGNALTVLAGPIIMGSHIITAWIWYAAATFVTSVHHSGYHLPLLPSPEFHDYHHLTFNWNFGTLGFIDRWHGTDSQFLGTAEFARHRTLVSLTPMSEQFPDKPTLHPGSSDIGTNKGETE